MNFQELIEELKKFEGTEEYTNFITGLITSDRVKTYLDTDDGKKLLQPRLDKYHNKSLETWKANNLQGLVDARVKELHPDADPKDIEIERLKAELATKEREATREKLTNKALSIANEKGLPVDLISYFVGEDEDSTIENLDNLEKVFTNSVASTVEKKLKDTSYVPPKDESEPVDGVTAAMQALNPGLKF